MSKPHDAPIVRESPAASAVPLSSLREITAKIAERAKKIDLTDEATQSERLTVKVRYAALALYLGDPSVASPMCALGPDPTERTAFTLRLKDWPADLSPVRELLATTNDEPLRSAVCAAIDRFPKATDPDHDELVAVLQALFETAPDGGSHSAIDWTLRQWGVALPPPPLRGRFPRSAATGLDSNALAAERENHPGKQGGGKDSAQRRWYVNSAGMTFVEIPAGKYTIGDEPQQSIPPKPPERPVVELTRPVFLSNREVSVAQFVAFVNDPNTPAAQKPEKRHGHAKEYSPTDECPVQQVNWFDSVLYCNWLSRKEGLTPCYQTTGKKLKLKNYDDTEYEAEDWQLQIDATGYRLPTEAEWEAACRACTTTAWSCGQDEVALSDFVFVSNSRTRTWPGGTKLPNGFGLFDTHGNVWEWCQDWYGESISGGSDPRGPATGQSRLLRGGSFLVLPQVARSAGRSNFRPSGRGVDIGFRLARTKD